jgi:hypothetical protein
MDLKSPPADALTDRDTSTSLVSLLALGFEILYHKPCGKYADTVVTPESWYKKIIHLQIII